MRSYVATTSGQTHLRTAGEASDPAVVLLHQSPLSSAMYEPTIGPLAKLGWFVIAPDLPGFGQSDRPTRPWAIADFAQWLWELLDGLSVGSVHVVGQHTGATIAVEAYLHQPERIDSLILQGLPVYSERERRQKLATYAPGYERDRAGTHLMTVWERICGLYPEISVEDACQQALEYLSVGPDYGFAYRAVFEYEMKFDELQTAPISFLQGERDLVERMRDEVSTAFPAASYETIPGTDFVSIEHPDQFAAAVDRTLRRPPNNEGELP